MPQNQRWGFEGGDVVIDVVQIGVADAAGRHAHEQLMGADGRRRYLRDDQRPSRSFEHGSAHVLLLSSTATRQRWRQTGGRFSRNAAMPSRASSVVIKSSR